jgi:lysophospholipase L1-like esterase
LTRSLVLRSRSVKTRVLYGSVSVLSVSAVLGASLAAPDCSGSDGGGGTGSAGDSGNAGSGGASPTVGWLGRVNEQNGVGTFAWQGAGVVATVRGATLSAKLRTEGTSTVFFQPVVDGKALPRFEVPSGADQDVTFAKGLTNGAHAVELYRDTEGGRGKSTFLGFTSGSLGAAPAPNPRLIEIVGDSISAGYGDLGAEPHPNWVANPACHYTPANSSWYQTYGAIAGHAFGAEVSTIARSGWGMVRAADGSLTDVLSSVYEDNSGTSAGPAWTFSREASLVVINLGTNDWAHGDPGAPFETAYLAFIEQVRAHYPDAWLFLTIGSMLAKAELGQVSARLATIVKARSSRGDTKITAFDFGTQNLGSDGSIPSGCDWHPNIAEHQRMAEILEAQIRAKLGW